MGCGSSTHKQKVVPIWRIRWSWGMMGAYWTIPQNIQNPDSKTIILPKTMWENHWFKQTMLYPKKLGRTFWFRQLPTPSFPSFLGAPTKPVVWGQVKIKQLETSGDDPDLPHEDFDPKNLRKIWQNQTWGFFRFVGQFSGFCWILPIIFFKVSPIKIHMIPF